jgi:UDP-N-acetylmuramate--alanine ligase
MAKIPLASLDKSRPIHFAGIAGSAMNGLAKVFCEMGFRVVGTDPRAESIRAQLAAFEIEVFKEQDGSRIPSNASLVVASAALAPSHAEIMAAEKRDIPVITYAECVGALMSDRRGVAVAGTHGKTTVTSMIVTVLKKMGLTPGFVIGGYIPAFGAGAEAGDGDLFVAEACEYNRSFLQLHPQIAVITNIEADHLDIYGTLDNVKKAFKAFTDNLPDKKGVLVYSATCPNTLDVIRHLGGTKVSFGIGSAADVTASNIRSSADGVSFSLSVDGRILGEATLAVPGRHNVENALAAIAVCRAVGIEPMAAAVSLADFAGAGRRFEFRGEAGGVTVIDDYAHHPTALALLIEAARDRFPGRHIVLAFQPHQYSRTNQLLESFGPAVAGAGRVIIPNIYSARDTEEEIRRFDPERLVAHMSAHGAPTVFLGGLEKLTGYLLDILLPNDVLITAGAGDIDSVIPTLLSQLEKNS